MSEAKKRIVNEGAKKSKEQNTSGLIGHVIRYHPESLVCPCSEHGVGAEFQDTERHTADIKVELGKRIEELKRVPCMVYSQGLVSNGLVKGDRVWVQFVNGDTSLPVITGYYREPSKWELTSNTLRYSIASIFGEMTNANG